MKNVKVNFALAMVVIIVIDLAAARLFFSPGKNGLLAYRILMEIEYGLQGLPTLL